MIKPISSPLMKPLLVFVNPKSGGNQVRFSLISVSADKNSSQSIMNKNSMQLNCSLLKEVLAVECPLYLHLILLKWRERILEHMSSCLKPKGI